MKISVMNGHGNTSQLSHRSFPDSVLLLDIAQVSETRKNVYSQHRLDNLSIDTKKQLLKEHTMLKNKSKNLGLNPKSQLPLKSKVAEHRWIVTADKANHVYILLVVTGTPESFIKRLQRRLEAKVAQVMQKEENFQDTWVQEKFSELLDGFNEALKKQHFSDFLSSSEFEGTMVSVDRSKADVEQPLEPVIEVDQKQESKLGRYKPQFKVKTLKLAIIIMVGLFLIICLLHRFTAPQRTYQLKRKISHKI